MTTVALKGPSFAGHLPDALAGLLDRQYHVIARRQARVYGISGDAMAHRLKNGDWQKILPGVYSTLTGPLSQDQKLMAALLHAGPGAILTGAWAVRRYHVDCAGLNEVHVLVPAKVRVKSYSYVQIQRTTRMPASVSTSKGIKFAPLARAVGDAARLMLQRDHVQSLVCAAIQKGKCPLEDLIAELKAGPAAGSALFRAALAELVAGIRSEAERDLKSRIEHSGLDQPVYNASLYLPDGTFLGMVDEWWQRAGVALEVDSRQYHFEAAEYLLTTRRHNTIEAAGVNLLHFLPMDVKQDWPRVRATIRDAIATGLRRPPLPVIGVPHGIKDHEAYLLTRLGSDADRLSGSVSAMAPSLVSDCPRIATIAGAMAPALVPTRACFGASNGSAFRGQQRRHRGHGGCCRAHLARVGAGGMCQFGGGWGAGRTRLGYQPAQWWQLSAGGQHPRTPRGMQGGRMATIGLLHPGEMGAAVGGCLAAAGHTVLWDPEGRSRATTGRALGAGLDGAGLAAVLGRSTVIFSICPPHAALDVAHQVAEGGFGGIYVDANAVSVATARRVAAVVEAAGASYVDGGLIGPPPENAGHTRLYLSGKRAPEVQVLLRRSALEARIADGPQFAASSVKMAYAAWTKGTSALLLAVRALARAEGVERTLLAEWALSQQSLPAQSEGAALAAALKGWRWIGEMDEIAASMATAGLPTGFHEAAADVYDRAARSTATGPADGEGDSSRRIGGRPATARSARGGEPGAAALDAVLSALL